LLLTEPAYGLHHETVFDAGVLRELSGKCAPFLALPKPLTDEHTSNDA
jgi:hypothetical protein